jgi:TonB family protein
VLLPPQAVEWTSEQFETVLRHESAHVKRRDSHSLLLAHVVCALYWFHPLVWYAARRLRIEQEHAADDLVLETGMAPADYAGALVGIVRCGRPEVLLAGAGTVSMLEARVKAILDGRRRRTMASRRVLAAALTLALAIALPLAALQEQRKIYRIGDGVTAPEVIHKQEPQYTEEARDAKIEGAVLLSVIVEVDGKLSNIRIVRGLDDGLDANAVAALKEWVFRPAEKDGQPVPVSANIEVNFRLL